MKKEYGKPVKYHKATLDIVDNVNKVLDAEGSLTARQIFYALVREGSLQCNKHGYTSLITAMKNGRMGGLIDWDMVIERAHTQGATSGMVHVVTDKHSLVPQLRNHLDHRANVHVIEGYPGNGTLEWYARQFENNAVVLHLADYDLRGLQASVDLSKRLQIFNPTLLVRRVGLFEADAVKYNLPKSPSVGSQFASYELEALSKKQLNDMVFQRVMECRRNK